MSTEPQEEAVHASDAAGPGAPRAFRTSPDGRTPRGEGELDVARHLVLAREALPPDPRDTIPSAPRLPLQRTEDVGEGERLDARGDAAPRRFRTRAPVALVPRRPLPAAGEALLEGLAALQAELDEGRERVRRLDEALAGVAAALVGVGAPAPAVAVAPRATGRTAAHSLGIEMAVSGFSRAEVADALVRQRAVDVGGVLDEVFGPGSAPDARI